MKLLFACLLSSFSCGQLCNRMDCRPPGSCPWDSPGKNTGVGFHALLQEISPTQGLNEHFFKVACIGRWVLYH